MKTLAKSTTNPEIAVFFPGQRDFRAISIEKLPTFTAMRPSKQSVKPKRPSRI